ncbi:angiogenic factor with G patch and FHA domains 1-like isoform X2 [Ostrea edulis]|uniref:angiogenic factor with G patch and FHA domains 1-like isoform X2 n=1 Tax=Ostrea edulis TaxID=37623 RepID=UPI0024AFDA0B|nr:angiogenic factor with G patch and FHA domains 1-like isoform X2 [Ostrea edulis]
MFRLINPDVTESECNARKETNASEGSLITEYKSQAADGCEQCQKTENDLIECRKKLERTQRQLTKANDYNEDLRKQIHSLSSELHEFRSKAKRKTDVSTQAEFDIKSSLCGQGDENTTCENYEQDANSKPENLSIADELKQAAEEAVQETGYVYDESSGLYYDKNSGYYYDHETAMHYDPYTGTYYTYNSYSGTYVFHSQVDPSYIQDTNGGPTTASTQDYHKSQTHQDSLKSDAQNDRDSFKDYREPEAETNAASATTPSKKNKKRKNKAKKAQDMAENHPENRINSVTTALQNIHVSDPHSYPPCIRLIVTDSDQLDYGSLFIITCDGGTIGREKNIGNVIIIPDNNISRIHAQLKYDYDTHQYHLIDFGSQNGTFLNEQRISEPKCSSSSVPVSHGDSVQIGCTRFFLHIHYGNETCDQCEPGQVQAAFQAQKTKDIPILTKEEKKKQARQELNQIKKKYGLKNAAYVENSQAVSDSNYRNRAEERRQTKGSDNPHQVDEAPASVHRPITENNVGHRLLKKMGWSEGESLGKDNSGIQDPVSVSFRVNQKAGLGSTEACASSLDNIETTNKSKRWLEAQKRYRKALAEKQMPTPAWVRSSKLKPKDSL